MAFTGFFSSVKRKLVGQRGEDLIYEGWSCELQEELRWLRDRRIGTDLNLGIYGDAHADIILACTDVNFLRKVNSFIENLSEDEKVKTDLPIDEENEDGSAPPEYEECEDALTSQEKEDMNKAAEKNLKMLEEKLKMLEAMVEKEEEEKKKKLRKISECPALENEDQSSAEAVQTEDLLIDIETEDTIEDKTEEKPEKQPEASSAETTENTEGSSALEETTEATEDLSKETTEPSITMEDGPEEPEVVEENLKKASKDEETEKEEEEKRHAEKEKEALAQANQTIEYIESKSDLPPTYQDACPIDLSEIDLTAKTTNTPAIAAICAYFYTGEILVSKTNYEELREYGIELNIEAFVKASEEFVEMMGPDNDEESDIQTLRYKYRDQKGAAIHLLTVFETIRRGRKTLKTEVDIEKSDMEYVSYADDSDSIHRILFFATCHRYRKLFDEPLVADPVLDNAERVIMKKIVEFIYTGHIPNLTQTIAREILILSKQLEFDRLQSVMVDWLVNRIRPDNCIELQLIGSEHEIESLVERSRKYSLRNFKEVTKTESFKDLPKDWLLDYIEDDLVEVDFPAEKGELLLFKQVKKWAEAHPGERSSDFHEIIQKGIRFHLMSLVDLTEVVAKDVMILEDEKSTNQIVQVIEHKTQDGVSVTGLRGSEAVIIAGGSVPIIDEFKGGIYDGEDHHVYDSSILAFNPKTYSTHLIANLPEKVCLHQVCIVGSCLFVAGGFDGFSCIIPDFYRLDLSTGVWTQLPNLKTKRACFQLIALNHHLFAMGGLTPTGFTKSVERFDMVTHEWEIAASLKEPRYRHAACVTARGKILLTGGITRSREKGVPDVSEYNPDSNHWTEKQPMHQARDSHGMISKGRRIFVIGGQEKERAGVEVYSIDLDQWTQLQTAPRIQYMAACGLANKKIFMIGGWHTDTESLNVVATYDYENDEWGEEGQLSLARGSADATVTKIPRSYWFNKFEFIKPKKR